MTNVLKAITARVRGTSHGPITRLISPEALGERLKPFVFLDFFSAEVKPGFGFGMHPHSGIATLTWQPGCDVQYEDTTGHRGTLRAGGLEWMNAGGGAWHQGFLMGSGPAIGFQLWVPMPPELENGASQSQYIPPELVSSSEFDGANIKVLLGSLQRDAQLIESPIDSHQDMNYWVLELRADARWRYQPPVSHAVSWAFAFQGEALVQGIPTLRELLILDGPGAIEVAAPGSDCKILIGTARPYPYPLVLGPSSIHTNIESLAKGLTRIEQLGLELKGRGSDGRHP